MKKYIITAEWNESDILPHGHCTANVTAYGLRTEQQVKDIVYNTNRYSPYDYADWNTYESKDDYERTLKLYEENGANITRYENQ